jgi:hypothetical protein
VQQLRNEWQKMAIGTWVRLWSTQHWQPLRNTHIHTHLSSKTASLTAPSTCAPVENC